MDNKLKWIWAVLVFGTGSKYIREIIYRYGSIEKAYDILADSSVETSEKESSAMGLSSQIKRKIRTTPISQCEMILTYCSEKDITIITYDSEEYPESLRNIIDPPALLFCTGNVSLLEEKTAISVVGTRKASEYSLKVADIICKDLAYDGFTIVSGFANGIDSASHHAAVSAGGKTIAVIGCGNDVEYPKGSMPRKSEIIDNGGLIVSEYLPGTLPLRQNFPKRNRILAALGLGTFVIQAPEKSGSLITAELALEMGKDIFCIPPTDIFDKSYAGVIKYLRDGATPVFSHLDIVNSYYYSYPHKLKADRIFSIYKENKNVAEIKEKSSDIPKENKISKKKSEEIKVTESKEIEIEPQIKKTIDFSEYDESQRKILELLSESGKSVHADEIAEKTGVSPTDLMAALTELEIYGAVKQLPGNMYELK